MTPAPYYTGDGVPLKFNVSDADGVVNPVSCLVHILTPSNSYIDNTEAAVDGNEVSYNIPGALMNMAGVYKTYFVLTLPSGLERTHKVEFTVIANPQENR